MHRSTNCMQGSLSRCACFVQALEETTVENNKIEHEVALLRTKVHGEMKRSKSAPSLVRKRPLYVRFVCRLLSVRFVCRLLSSLCGLCVVEYLSCSLTSLAISIFLGGL